MSELYCISYSDFGYLLTEKDWSIKIHKLKDYDFEVYEDLLTSDGITLKRRFLGSVPDLFENSSEFKSEPELPSDIERFLMTYNGTEVVVVGSYDFERLFSGKDKAKDEYGFVKVDKALFTCNQYSSEDLAEDVVLLASNGIDLNSTDNLSEV
ncbi:MAG: hypothetical protein IJ254_04175 [Succinivibrio sp.]|jgi:hypothetical protein|nr:hypothetical protein [Succinivibrio sp.]